MNTLFHSQRFPKFLFGAYILLFLALGIEPYARDVWFVENLTILGVVAGLVILYFRGIRFSNLAYLLMSFLIVIHTVGGHYTFERVPFGWINDLFGFSRNMYDRIGHFTVGFYAFAIAEYLTASGAVKKPWLIYAFSLFAIGFVAMLYEIFEWQFAILSDPEAGLAVLGSQGDIWDAQKDMLSDALGAVAALSLFALFRKRAKV